MIRRLHAGRVDLAGQFNPPTFRDTRIDVFAYLVVIDDEVLLVDTGVGFGNRFVDNRFQPSDRNLIAQLRDAGVRPTDVTGVVNSHLHFDHCGGNEKFTNARIFIQQCELEIARRGRYTVRQWFDYPDADIRPIDGDHSLSDHVTLIKTPGHSPGHQSIVVETADETVVIAAQCAFRSDEFARGGDADVQAHDGLEADYVASIERIKSIDADRVLFSHDDAEIRSRTESAA